MSGAVRSTTNNLGLGVLNFNFPNWGDDANKNTKVVDAAFSLTGVSLSGVWNNNTAYTAGQLLVDPDTNEVYRAQVTHTSAVSGLFSADRAANPTYWELVSTDYQFRGEWEGPGISYAVGDLVYSEEQYVYAVCLVQHISGAQIRDDEVLGNWLFIVDLEPAVTTAEAAAISAAESAEIASGIVSGDIGPAIAGSSNKSALVAADRFAITDSEAAHVLSHTTWQNILDAMEAVNDLAYAAIVHTHAIADTTGLQAALDAKAPLANAALTGATTIAGTLTLAADPLSSLQAATKQYVDGLLANLGKRATVRVATTANITISTALNAGDTIDGIVLQTGDYILVKNQNSPAENGIYQASPAPFRVTEFDTFNEHPGALISVQEGTVNADKLFLCVSNVGGTIDANSITFTQMVTAGEMLAANNLSDVANAATAFANIKQAASEIATGVVEMATVAEALAGVDTSRAVTAAGVKAYADAAAAAVVAGINELFVNAEDCIAGITNGAQAGVRELTTNDQVIFYHAFDTTTQEFLYYKWYPPKRWNLGTITCVPYWTAESSSGTVEFEFAAVAVPNDGALDASFGTAVPSSDTLLGINDIHIGPTTAAITVGGTPADADFVWIRIARDVANDTLAADAQLIGFKIRFTVDQGNDA